MEPGKPLRNIVLADDDSDHGILFAHILRMVDPGIGFSQVFNGSELLEFLHTHEADLVFLDQRMPFKNGDECLDDIRNDSQLQNLPVIMYSASAQMQDIQRSFSHLADIYMVKPFNSEHLRRALESILSLDWAGGAPMKGHYFINNRFVPFTAHA